MESIVELHEWLSDNRYPARSYKFNPKHGDANHKALPHSDRLHGYLPSAQLLTDETATNNLLKKAIGETQEGDLWFYDDTKGCFIYFENQGNTPQHEYHAYHLHYEEKNYNRIKVEKQRIVQPAIPSCT